MLLRIVAGLILISIALCLPWPFFIGGLIIYSFVYEGLEVLFLAFLLDAYIGHSVPWMPIPAVYTVATTGILILVWGMKPLFFIESRI